MSNVITSARRSSSAVSDEQLISASTVVVGRGPAGGIANLVRELQGPPLHLPADVARGVVIGARVTACNVAATALEALNLLKSDRNTLFRGLRLHCSTGLSSQIGPPVSPISNALLMAKDQQLHPYHLEQLRHHQTMRRTLTTRTGAAHVG